MAYDKSDELAINTIRILAVRTSSLPLPLLLLLCLLDLTFAAPLRISDFTSDACKTHPSLCKIQLT
jgi:hypothetical protein